MFCCLFAGVLAFAGVKSRRSGRAAAGLAALGACCGALTFEVAASLFDAAGGMRTARSGLLLAGTVTVTAAGVALVRGLGIPTGRRAWALFGLAFSGGSAVAELLDLHLFRIHLGPGLAATVVLHGLSVVAGLAAAQLLLTSNRRERAAAPRRSAASPARAASVAATVGAAEPVA